MTKTNGRIIGPYQTVNISSAGGVHDSFDQYNYKLLGEWVYSPTVEVSLSTTSLNETTNKDLVVTLNTTGYASGTQFSVEAVNVSNFSSSDMNPYSGTVTVSGNEASATGNTTLSVVADATDETPDTETFKVEVRGPTPATTLLATSSNVTITDTSTAPPALSLSFQEQRNGNDIGAITVFFCQMNSTGSSIAFTTSVYTALGNSSNLWVSRSGSGYPNMAVGTRYRVAWLHNKGNTGFTGDYAIDQVNITGTTYDFNANATGWLTTTAHTTSISTAFLNSSQVPTSTTAVRSRWNRNQGATPSTGTGPSSGYNGSGYYLYTEASSPNTTNPTYFWLFSPELIV